jgi:preprotein translocase subunit YajC
MHQLAVFIAQDAAAQPSGYLVILPYILIGAVMYFLLLRPQMKQRKKIEEDLRALRDGLKNGDKVVTSGGILGVVMSVRDETVQLRIADGIKIEVLRSAITSNQADPVQSTETK